MATTPTPAQVPASTSGAASILAAQAGNSAAVLPAKNAAKAQNNNRKLLDEDELEPGADVGQSMPPESVVEVVGEAGMGSSGEIGRAHV